MNNEVELTASLKPFNLERALAGDPVKTREGKLVTQFSRVTVNGKPLIVGVFTTPDHTFEYTGLWREDGTVAHKPCPIDLFMAPRKVTRWLNVYDRPGGGVEAWVYQSKKAADAMAARDRIGEAQEITVDI